MELVLVNRDFSSPRAVEGIDNIGNIDFYASYVMTEIVLNNMCIGLNPEYLEKSIGECDWILMLMEKSSMFETVTGEVLAFATIKKNKYSSHNNSNNLKGGGKQVKQKCLYVDVLCSQPGKGYGNILMNAIKRIQKAYEFPQICLCSLESSIGFYQRQGFNFEERNNTSDVYCGNQMPLMLYDNDDSGGGKRKQTRKRRMRKAIINCSTRRT